LCQRSGDNGHSIVHQGESGNIGDTREHEKYISAVFQDLVLEIKRLSVQEESHGLPGTEEDRFGVLCSKRVTLAHMTSRYLVGHGAMTCVSGGAAMSSGYDQFSMETLGLHQRCLNGVHSCWYLVSDSTSSCAHHSPSSHLSSCSSQSHNAAASNPNKGSKN
jgi:hypothetical protein